MQASSIPPVGFVIFANNIFINCFVLNININNIYAGIKKLITIMKHFYLNTHISNIIIFVLILQLPTYSIQFIIVILLYKNIKRKTIQLHKKYYCKM